MTTTIDGHKYVAFTAKAKQPDGSYLLAGRISDTSLDLDGQRVDPDWLDREARDWFKGPGNVRLMHQAVVVGKAKTLTGSGADGFDITAKIVDTDTIMKLDEDLFGGFSIGIKGTRVDRTEKALSIAPNGIINGGKIIEVSIVDVPANPSAVFKLAKAAEVGDTLNSVVDGAVPCSECSGIGKTLVDGDWMTCPKCNGDGEGKNDILPGLNSGPDEHGEMGKAMTPDKDCATCKGSGKIKNGKVDCPDCMQSKAAYFTDIYGWSDAEKAVWSDDQKSADLAENTYKKSFSDKERSDLADKGQAMPDGSYPIPTVASLKDAIQAFGRAKNKPATKRWIIQRAKALNSIDLLPDSWNVTSKMADALIALSVVNKSAEPGQWTHDPEMLATIKQGIVACIQQELEELCDGEDERWDLMDLMSVLNGFLSWQLHEAFGGETSSPFAQGDDMDMMTLGVSADTLKAARADDATEEQKQAPIAELRKALGLEEIAVSTEDIVKKVADLTVVVEKVSKMSAPREWALRQSEEQTETASQLEVAQRELNQYKSAIAELSSPQDRAAYEPLIAQAQSKVDALTSKIGALT